MLITVIVITYNSKQYVLETLESVYRQTYRDIELIISDDCSTDDTFDICNEWANRHASRFTRCMATQTSENGGICPNYNHALRYAAGEYVKYIAGDDILKDNAIERFIANIQEGTHLYLSGAERIYDNGDWCCEIHEKIPNGDARLQLKTMLRFHPLVFGPCIFIQRKKLVELGGFDETFPMSEDYPLLMKYLTNNEKCRIISEPLVKWRMHSDSVSCSNTNNFKSSVKKATLHYSIRYSWKLGLFFTPYHDWVDFWIPEHYSKGVIYQILGYVLRCFDIIHIMHKLFGWPEDCITVSTRQESRDGKTKQQ